MNAAVAKLKELLPFPLHRYVDEEPEELRLKRGAQVMTMSEGVLTLRHLICTDELMDEVFLKLTNRSYYSHAATVNEGYLALPCGLRAGVAGRAAATGGKITAVRDLSFLSLRIPRPLPGIDRGLIERVGTRLFRGGALIYAPPGVGKTTLLRELARRISSPPYLIPTALADERGELSFDLDACPALTVYLHYPKAKAAECALRTVSPRALFTDEIGPLETNALSACAVGGVPVFASAHADSLSELLSKPGMRALTDSGCFAYVIGLRREEGRFLYDVHAA